MPKSRQSLLFSATISSQVRDFALSGIKDYRMLQVDKESKLSDDLKLHFFMVRTGEKPAALLYVMRELIECPQTTPEKPQQQTIIFGATRYHVEYMHELATHAGFKCTFIFGAMDQRTREERLLLFRHKKVNFLIVTDLAARGIDIPLLDNVIHYDFPPKLKLFIHRAGRTARNGQKGTSYSLITKEEVPYMHDLSIYVGRKYYDGDGGTTEDGKTLKDLLSDPQHICFGKLPQSTLDEYSLLLSSLHERFPSTLDPLQRSVALSL
jgi:ATP-dependent RNA helicase DDX54/DBP10